MAGLRLGDRLILDGADHVVTAVVIGRVDRLNFRQVTMRPELGGDEVRLLQVEDLGFFEGGRGPLVRAPLAGGGAH
jgi:hypothetical protein